MKLVTITLKIEDSKRPDRSLAMALEDAAAWVERTPWLGVPAHITDEQGLPFGYVRTEEPLNYGIACDGKIIFRCQCEHDRNRIMDWLREYHDDCEFTPC